MSSIAESMALTVEEVIAQYFDKEAMREPLYKLYRISTPKGRYYYTFQDGRPVVFMGMTTMLSETMRQPEGLIKWIAEMGYNKSREYMNVMASYGSLMHNEIANYHINNRKYDLDLVETVVRTYVEAQPRMVKESEYFNLHEWIDRLKHDMVSWDAFVKKHNVVPIAIEMPLAHVDGYSGTIDIPCWMDVEEEGHYGEVYKSGPQKDQPKLTKRMNRYRCIIDMKSTRKGTGHEDKKFQLIGYKRLWEFNFPDAPIDKLFNWSPKDWDKIPSWTLSEKTGSVENDEFDAMMALARRRLGGKDPVYIDLNGEINPDTVASDYVKTITLEDHILRKQEAKKEAKKEAGAPHADPYMAMLDNLQQRIIELETKLLTAKPVRKSRKKKSDPKIIEVFDHEQPQMLPLEQLTISGSRDFHDDLNKSGE